MASAKKTPAAKAQPLIVCDSDVPNIALRCAGGRRVHTTAELLMLASPTVLRGAVEAARGADQQDGEQLAVIPMDGDDATTWLHALQMAHPGVYCEAAENWVSERPGASRRCADCVVGRAHDEFA
jgi:hypothetical protein